MKAKRFWDQVQVVEDEGFQVKLDDRFLKTPNNADFVLPSRPLAEGIASEWESLEGEIDPSTMPLTKMANTAVDRIPETRQDVQDHVLEYLDNDLLVFRAPEPEALIERQKIWDPWIEWVRAFGIELVPTHALTASHNAPANAAAASMWLEKLDNFELVAFCEFVALTGSFVLGMAICEDEISAEGAFDLSRLEEDFQSETWGAVDVKLEERDYKRAEILHAKNLIKLLRQI